MLLTQEEGFQDEFNRVIDSRRENKNIKMSAGYILTGMTDEEIDLVGPGLLESYEMTLADANSRILLAQSFTANGVYIDDINRSFEELCASFDANEEYSEKKKGFLRRKYEQQRECERTVEGGAAVG